MVTAVLSECHRTARADGLAAGLSLLCSTLPPGVLPCGPAGTSVLPSAVVPTADQVRCMTTLAGFDLPGGRVEVLRWATRRAAEVADDVWAAWTLGLVWVRLGLSEALRDECVRYLRGRRSGDSTLLQQQLVKGALADALAEQLEIRAVLTGLWPADVTPLLVNGLNRQVTLTDRALLRLLGATSMLLGGPGEVAYVSELVADAYLLEEDHDQPGR